MYQAQGAEENRENRRILKRTDMNRSAFFRRQDGCRGSDRLEKETG